MGLDSLTQLRILLGSIGVGEAWPCGKFPCLGGLEPCGPDIETGSRMEVAGK